jgi:hypothetical protein
MRTPRLVAAISLAGAISLAAMPLQAAPLTSLSAAAKPIAQDNGAIQVRWGGWHGGWGWHGGGWGVGLGALAAGALIGAAIASPYEYGYPYYGAGYPYYRYPAYGYSYGYPYRWGFSTTTVYPAYSYYRPYRHFYYRPHRRFYVRHRPFWHHSFGMHGGWRHSYGMYRVHHHYRVHHRRYR